MSSTPNPPRVIALYSAANELRSLKLRSRAAASLSKVQAHYHELFFPEPTADRPYIFASIVLSFDGKMAYPDDSRGPLVASNNSLDPDGGAAGLQGRLRSLHEVPPWGKGCLLYQSRTGAGRVPVAAVARSRVEKMGTRRLWRPSPGLATLRCAYRLGLPGAYNTL